MKKYKLSFLGQVNASINNRFPHYIFELKHIVDIPVLSDAVNKAMEMHPYFKIRLVEEKGLFYLEENPKKAVVKAVPWNEMIRYGNEEYNEYPWIITCDGCNFLFTCAHMLCDGMGAISFLKTVFRLYFESRGVVFSANDGFLTPEEVVKTIVNAYSENAIKNAKAPFKKTKCGEALPIPLSFFESDNEKIRIYQLEFDRNVIHERSQANETSTFSVIASVLSKAMALALDKEQGNIKVLLAVNLRSTYDSTTDRDFVLTPDLDYDIAKLKNRPLFLAETAFRSQLDIFMDKDNLDYEVAKEQQKADLLDHFPVILDIAKDAFYEMFYAPKARIIYSHLTSLGFTSELEEQFERFYVSSSKTAAPLIVAMGSTFQSKTYLTLAQSTKDNVLVKSIEDVLKEEDIPYQINKLSPHAVISYEPDLYERLAKKRPSIASLILRLKRSLRGN